MTSMRQNSRNGFSLLELAVVISIVAFMTAVSASMSSDSSDSMKAELQVARIKSIVTQNRQAAITGGALKRFIATEGQNKFSTADDTDLPLEKNCVVSSIKGVTGESETPIPEIDFSGLTGEFEHDKVVIDVSCGTKTKSLTVYRSGLVK